MERHLQLLPFHFRIWTWFGTSYDWTSTEAAFWESLQNWTTLRKGRIWNCIYWGKNQRFILVTLVNHLLLIFHLLLLGGFLNFFPTSLSARFIIIASHRAQPHFLSKSRIEDFEHLLLQRNNHDWLCAHYAQQWWQRRKLFTGQC